MTPKEKAKELIYKMSYWHMVDGGTNQELAKQCALIAVDEILSLNVFEYTSDWSNTIEYLEEVKKEIINL
jgi:pentose-5-phosphate-3-epimerase